MTAVSVNNQAQAILIDIRDALASATIEGSAVFDRVIVTTSIAEARDMLLSAGRVGIVLFEKLQQQDDTDLKIACLLHLKLILAGKADGDSERVDQALLLACAAKNVIEADPPDGAMAILTQAGRDFHTPIQWGDVMLDSGDRAPWGVCELSLTIAFQVESPIAH